MPSLRHSRRIRIVLTCVILVAVFGWFGNPWRFRKADTTRAQEVTRLHAGSESVQTDSPTGAVSATELVHVLETTAANLRSSHDSAPEALMALRAMFHELDACAPAERLAALTTFLASGKDAPTGLTYSVGPGGFLRGWPTLRVALLDYAGRLEPAAMHSLSAQALVDSNSPDEWSVALRNLARAEASDVLPELAMARTHELLSNEAWAAAPSAGYLEAFDLVVYGRLLGALPRLEILMSPDSPRAVRFAAFLTVDRLAMARPEETLAFLNRDTSLLTSVPTVRAGVFARADVRDSAERAVLERYLARADLDAAERMEFARLFPNHNSTFAHTLLTPALGRPQDEMIARDRAAAEALVAWSQDRRYSAWTGAFTVCQDRLNTHLAQLR